MAEKPKKDSFNDVARRNITAAVALAAAIAGVQQDDIHTQYEDSLNDETAIPQRGQERPPLPSAVLAPQVSPQGLREIWALQGLEGEKFNVAFSALSPEQTDSLTRRSKDLFALDGFTGVMQRMADGKQKKITEMIEKIADLPDGMRLITTDYVSIETEQNKAVWLEFQERAEPAFYRHLAATQEKALREAGFCDHAIDCMRRGYGPTDENGLHYNVDIDHLTERKGGGALCLEKSVDPVLGGAPMYAINHAANLCLIMRDVHVQTKNVINNLQDINNIPAGETRRILMAVPEEGKELMMLHAQDMRAAVQPPVETSYYALGPSLLMMRALERYKDNIVAPREETTKQFFDGDMRASLSHTLKLWTALAHSLEQAQAEGSIKAPDIKGTAKNCNDYLKPLENIMAEIHAPRDAIESLAQVSNRIYTILSPPADSGRAPSPSGA